MKATLLNLTIEYHDKYDITEKEIKNDLKDILKITYYEKIKDIDIEEGDERVNGIIASIVIEL